jgi:hypothetical protein
LHVLHVHAHRTHFLCFFFLIASHFQAQPYPTKPPKGISCRVKQELHFQCRQFQLLTWPSPRDMSGFRQETTSKRLTRIALESGCRLSFKRTLNCWQSSAQILCLAFA